MVRFLGWGISLFLPKTKRGFWWNFLEKCGFGEKVWFCGF
jgi:hypothetical protein